MEFHETWQEAKSQPPQPLFFGTIGKLQWPPCLWFAENFFDLSETAEWNSTNLDRRQVLNVLHQICVFLVARYQHTCMFLSKKRYSGVRLWTCGSLVLLKCVNRSDQWPCQFSICYIQKISRHWILLNHTSIWLTIVCCCHHHFNFVKVTEHYVWYNKNRFCRYISIHLIVSPAKHSDTGITLSFVCLSIR